VTTNPAAAILLMGPTASGKSALAMKLAEHFPVEIISVDSVQIYLDMNVGTAKPGHEDRARVPHHLIDILAPTARYSAAQFARDADRLITEIRGRGKLPLLVGGTMLYFKALTHGLNDLPAANPAVRAAIDARAAAHGWSRLHEELAAIDPVTAARLQPADRQRIQRALEVFEISGRPLSTLLEEPNREATTIEFRRMALVPSDRAALHTRIAQRFDAMLDAGLVDEVRSLRERYALTKDLPAMRAVGYRQAWNYLDGAINFATLRNQSIFATRQLAKRQLTWLRATEAETFDCLFPGVENNAMTWVARQLQR
jgi:tRNA dimethylallyltransferase